jgi:hypothetical protein
MQRLLQSSRESRAREDELATRLVRAIRTRDSAAIRDLLNERISLDDDSSTPVSDDTAEEDAGRSPAGTSTNP